MIKHSLKLKKNYLLFICILIFACKSNNKLPDPLEAGWKNAKVCEVLEENDKLRTLKCVFAPGVGHEKHFHAAHFGYTISGSKFRITDKTGTREVNVPTGYNFYNQKIEWHNVLNIGDTTAVFLIIEPK
jgi:quercetin dioxygenase-like cupin family protein